MKHLNDYLSITYPKILETIDSDARQTVESSFNDNLTRQGYKDPKNDNVSMDDYLEARLMAYANLSYQLILLLINALRQIKLQGKNL